ncbi:MAG: BlaI/MecI/CopY family transcriptional regulator [Phycisphaerales bacterium]|nr:BlaI/MecI/CopY family transcriptional regulator [Phycisphaerae bacterium]NNF42644.1 BlaI/MecI/CopY family transcriptional regulator [Phycisphaerales bacterium]NNM26731.1 BlaI/MecI/CopY family transcriptional regulator [Phycisphaerales bacterium]
MARKRLDELGHLQQDVMEVIWREGEATVQQVRDALAGRNPAYTTVLSVLQKLEKAGWVTHRQSGRSYIYSALRSREQEGSNALRTFMDRVFRGDPALLLQHLIDDERLSDGDLAALRAMIETRRKERDTDGA